MPLSTRGLIERVTEGQNTTLWRALVGDSEIESPRAVSEIETPVIQKLNQSVSKNESQVGVKEKKEINTKNKLIINPITAELFTDTFGQFFNPKEQKRWEVLYDSVGPDKAGDLIAWASKKE